MAAGKTAAAQAKAAAAAPQDEPASIGTFALFLELENVALNAREAAYDIARARFREQGLELTKPLFARFVVQADPDIYLPRIAEALTGKKTTPKWVDQAVTAVKGLYAAGEAQVRPGMDDLVQAARQRGLPVAVISVLPTPAAQAAMDKYGLKERGLELFAFHEEKKHETFPGADTWMKMARALNKVPRRCVAVVSNAPACKSALSAGMRCVALPDEFTAHQDYSGAEVFLKALAKWREEKLLDQLFPAP